MLGAMRALRTPAVRALAAASAGAAGAAAFKGSACSLEAPAISRFDEVPAKHAPLASTPKVPYPGWDRNWDYLRLESKAVAEELGHEWPITDYAAAIRRVFEEHYAFSTELSKFKTLEDVEKHIREREADLPELYRESFVKYAWGGAPRRFIVLVRHGQYEEKGPRALEKKIEEKMGAQQYALDERLQRGAFLQVDEQRVLTPLGRKQAERVGNHLRDLLKPALETAGREGDVRIHVSTLARARETASIIASCFPDHVISTPPDSNLSEGNPALDMPGCLFASPVDINVEGLRIETAFRTIFHRGLPRKSVEASNSCKDGVAVKSPEKFRCEYDIVVCHGNVIRYFFMRALQLPPERWLRLGGFNGSFSILEVNPVSGGVGCHCFGDVGHMSPEEISFGMKKGLE